MLNSKTKKRIAINKLFRAVPKKRRAFLKQRAQAWSSQSLLSAKHSDHAEEAFQKACSQFMTLMEQYRLEDDRYYGRSRPCVTLMRHSSKIKKKAQLELWRNMEPRDVTAFVITDKGTKHDLKDHSYLDLLNALAN